MSGSGETLPHVNDFTVEDFESDLDAPTEWFASIPEAIEDIRQGKVALFFFSYTSVMLNWYPPRNDVKKKNWSYSNVKLNNWPAFVCCVHAFILVLPRSAMNRGSITLGFLNCVLFMIIVPRFCSLYW